MTEEIDKIENKQNKQIDYFSSERISINLEETKIINKIREIRSQRINTEKIFTIGYENDILILLDVLREINIEKIKKEVGWYFHLSYSDKNEIKNGIKLGISRSICREYQKKHPDSKLGGRKSRIDEILFEIHHFGYWLLTDKGDNYCLFIEKQFKKSTIYQALRKL